MNTFFIVPKTKIIDQIENIRKKYDPLYSKIQAHITVLFPDEFPKKEEELIACLNDFYIHKMNLKSAGLKMSFEGNKNYIFLIFEEDTSLLKLHDSLYQRIYHKDDSYVYLPHITLACLKTKEECEQVYKEISKMNWNSEIIIDNICIERIEKDEVSQIIFQKSFK